MYAYIGIDKHNKQTGKVSQIPLPVIPDNFYCPGEEERSKALDCV